MTIRTRFLALRRALAGLALFATPALADPQTLPAPVAPSLRAVPPAPLKPALWKVSDADTMLEYIAPGAKPPEPIAILTRQGCSFCAKAKQMLDEAGLSYAEVPLPHTIRSKALGAIASAGTVPQVFVGGKLIGGSEQLEAWLRERGYEVFS